MVIGVYFLTMSKDGIAGENRVFASFADALNAYDCRNDLEIQAKIKVRVSAEDANYEKDTEVIADGYFHESEYRSAPYFDIQIDGITLLNTNFG